MIVFLFSGWLVSAETETGRAQTNPRVTPNEAERVMQALTGENDADFEALIDPCFVSNGQRICPGTDSDPDAAVTPGSPPQRAVTWLPDVRGELTTSLALEDRIRERLAAGGGQEALADAMRLAALAESGGGAPLLISISLLGDCLYASGRFGEAEVQYRRVLALRLPKSNGGGPGSYMATASLLGKLANVYAAQNNLARAFKLSERAVRLGGDGIDPDGAWVLYNHARLAWRVQRYDEASRYFRRGADLFFNFYGDDSREAAYGLDMAGRLAMQRQDWREAVVLLRRAAAVQQRALDLRRSSQNAEPDERGAYVFTDLAAAAYALAEEQPGERDALLSEAFETAQLANQKTAAAALSQMAARQAKGTGALADLLRHQQDLVAEWHRTNRRLADALLVSNPKERAEDAAALRRRLADQEREIRQTDLRVAADFPGYFDLMKPTPLSLADVQQLLIEGEALVQFAIADNDVFVWAVSKDGASWRKAGLSTSEIAEHVQALRCGLDSEAWDNSRCRELTGKNYTASDEQAGKPLPFDYARAHKLYVALFGTAEDLINGKHLLLMPSGALTQLPFQVLVTAQPKDGDNRSIAWLIRDHPLTVLPAVSSLKALRRVARPSAATRPMIGFGNPLLDGPDSAYAHLAQLARDRTACATTPLGQLGQAAGPHASVAQVETRGGLADVSYLRGQPPLPETADELCAVARDVHADATDIYLGARATEREVKRLSMSGQLARYHIVHFATHGALAGQVTGNNEPGLLLTPPDKPSEEDDGYLTASEIAALKLDADWVILSACNTAAGGAKGAEALSGLARAFFYAQARALLVSHWAVNSDATVKLITGAMGRLANKDIGRAEAMRELMLALIDHGEPAEAHPAFWAPFVVVGNGGTSQ